jgi:hypothetical protein
MPRGSEPAPRAYAKLVSKELVAIAGVRGHDSGRAIAKLLGLSEAYVRSRVAPNPTASFTVTDVERFCKLVGISPALFLGDPSATRRTVVAEARLAPVTQLGVSGRGEDLDLHTTELDIQKIAATGKTNPPAQEKDTL